MGITDFFTTTVVDEAPVTAAASLPVTAAAEPVFPTTESAGVTRRQGATIRQLPWQERARRYYWRSETALDLAVEFVDLRSLLAALYPAKAMIRDMGNTWTPIDDEGVQAVADEWRDADSGEQFTLVQDMGREFSLVGEAMHRDVFIAREGEVPRTRYQILGTNSFDDKSIATIGGVRYACIQLRSDAGPQPRPGQNVPGRWEWVPEEALERVYQAGEYKHDASSPIQRGLRYLDRMAEKESLHAQRTGSAHSLNRLLLLATSPNYEKDDPDPVADGYWHAAGLTSWDKNDLMARYPVPFRVNEPDKAQIMDLIDKITQEELNEYQLLREQFATMMPMPKQALLEGAGASQRNLNNWMLDEGLHKQSIHPLLNEIFGSATCAFFRPMIRQLQSRNFLRGYDPEDLKMWWQPIGRTLADSEPAVIMNAWRLGLISKSEAQELLGTKGWTEEERPEVGDYEHWFIATRSISGMSAGPGARDLLEGWGPDAISPSRTEAPLELPAATASMLDTWR